MLQAQLQFSWLGSYSYTDSQGLYTKADSSWSLIGRVEFDLVDVVNEECGSCLYLKASLLHEFSDSVNVAAKSCGLYNYETGTYMACGSQSRAWAFSAQDFQAGFMTIRTLSLTLSTLLGTIWTIRTP
jgi:hypothetical protein